MHPISGHSPCSAKHANGAAVAIHCCGKFDICCQPLSGGGSSWLPYSGASHSGNAHLSHSKSMTPSSMSRSKLSSWRPLLPRYIEQIISVSSSRHAPCAMGHCSCQYSLQPASRSVSNDAHGRLWMRPQTHKMPCASIHSVAMGISPLPCRTCVKFASACGVILHHIQRQFSGRILRD